MAAISFEFAIDPAELAEAFSEQADISSLEVFLEIISDKIRKKDRTELICIYEDQIDRLRE